MRILLLSRGFVCSTFILAGLFRVGYGVAREAGSAVTVSASKYDTRSNADDINGCYDTGCEPEYTRDGQDNTDIDSRWSCQVGTSDNSTEDECWILYDMQEIYDLLYLNMYFYNSSDATRTKAFSVAISSGGNNFTVDFEGASTGGTPLGQPERFNFTANSRGRYVKIDSLEEVDSWLSINEVEIYIDAPASTSQPTFAPTLTSPGTAPPPASQIASSAPTAAPTPVEIYVGAPTPAPTIPTTAAPTSTPSTLLPIMPSPAPTSGSRSVVDDERCSSISVINAEELSGAYEATSTQNGLSVFTAAGDVAATIQAEETKAVCAANFSRNCSVQIWVIEPDQENSYPTFRVIDDAANPVDVIDVWHRWESGCTDDELCEVVPTNVKIVCGSDGENAVFTPSPTTAEEASNCTTIEVTFAEGDLPGGLSGFYVDDDSSTSGSLPEFNGYNVSGSSLISNGQTIASENEEGSCSSSTTSSSATCSWRQWWIRPADSNNTSFHTYDPADHPADIRSDTLWLISDTNGVDAFTGEIVIACTTALSDRFTPSPTHSADSSGVTRTPVSAPTEPPVSAEDSTNDSDDGEVSIYVVVGSVAGGVILLSLLAVGVVYRRRQRMLPPTCPPPSYDDLVGGEAAGVK